MLNIFQLSIRNLLHRRTRTMFLIALVFILSAVLFTSRILTTSMKDCIDKTVDRIGADVIVAPSEYAKELSDSLFSGELCSFYFERSLIDEVKKTEGIEKISPQLYIATLEASCCSVPMQIVAFEPDSDFIIKPWLEANNMGEIKKGQVVVGSKITKSAGDKISIFGLEYDVVGKLEETNTSYDNCAFMNFETAYTLFDSSQTKYVTKLRQPENYVSLLTIRTKEEVKPKEVADKISRTMRESGLTAYTAKAMSGKVADTLEQMQSYSTFLIILLVIMAILSLVCIFNITVHERLHEFGILLSVGARKSQILLMLLIEALLIGLIGGIFGVFVGACGMVVFKDLIVEALAMPYLAVNLTTYAITAVYGVMLALSVSLLATLYAAIRATKMSTYRLIQEAE